MPDEQWAKKFGREDHVLPLPGLPGPGMVQLARDGHYDLIIVAFPEPWSESRRDDRPDPVARPCAGAFTLHRFRRRPGGHSDGSRRTGEERREATRRRTASAVRTQAA